MFALLTAERQQFKDNRESDLKADAGKLYDHFEPEWDFSALTNSQYSLHQMFKPWLWL